MDVRGTAAVAGTANEGKQRRVEQYMKARRSAGKYRQKRGYDEPYTDMQGQTPAFIEGDQFGRAEPRIMRINRSHLLTNSTTRL